MAKRATAKKITDKYVPARMPSDEEIDEVLARIHFTKEKDHDT